MLPEVGQERRNEEKRCVVGQTSIVYIWTTQIWELWKIPRRNFGVIGENLILRFQGWF